MKKDLYKLKSMKHSAVCRMDKAPSSITSVSKAVFACIGLSIAGLVQANISVTFEAPTVVNTTTDFEDGTRVVETFDNRGASTGGLNNSNGIVINDLGTITGGTLYIITPPGDHGGAPICEVSCTRTPFISIDSGVTVDFINPQNYFGFWVSSVSGGEVIELFDASNSSLLRFTTANLNTVMGNGPYRGLNMGVNGVTYSPGQNFGFINFYDPLEGIKRVVLTGSNFEADNFTFGRYIDASGTAISTGRRPINQSTDNDSLITSNLVSTVFDGGTLILSSNNSRNFTITNNGGSIRVASGSVTLDGVITNEGSGAIGVFKKVGSGKLIFTKEHAYTGNTVVEEGTLNLAGKVSSDIEIKVGGRLQGSGSTSRSLVSSGRVAPGNSPGTLSVAGNVTLNSGSIFEAEIDGRT